MTLLVEGLQNVTAAFAAADRETRLGLRRDLRGVAEPIRREAEHLAVAKIRRMPRSPEWALMRTGVTRTVVYVAPRQRGVKVRGPDPRRRPEFANLLMDRAMEPALAHNEANVERETEAIFDRVAADFNRH